MVLNRPGGPAGGTAGGTDNFPQKPFATETDAFGKLSVLRSSKRIVTSSATSARWFFALTPAPWLRICILRNNCPHHAAVDGLSAGYQCGSD
jgi:hypothetical protein